MKSYISRKFPLETRITDQIAALRLGEFTKLIVTAAPHRVEVAVRIRTRT
jgi:hypothetical protein